jgi:probable F420-dependent oxidoreductase
MSWRPLRFGVLTGSVVGEAPTRASWVALVRKAEALGFSTLLVPDHLLHPLAPISALTVAAMATRTLRVGSFVFGNDFRNPVYLAHEAATLDVLSEGRFELGLGTGYMPSDYHQTGIALDPPGVRVRRLSEAVRIVKAYFAGEPFSFAGAHYAVTDLLGRASPVQRPHPPIMIGGGGRRILSLAAREADSVAFNLRTTPEGAIDLASLSPVATAEKVTWVRAAAGDRVGELEFCVLMYFVAVGKPPRAAAEQVLRSWRMGSTMLADELLATPHALLGDQAQIVEELQARRERYGFSYVVVFGDAMDEMAPVVSQLAGR